MAGGYRRGAAQGRLALSPRGILSCDGGHHRFGCVGSDLGRNGLWVRAVSGMGALALAGEGKMARRKTDALEKSGAGVLATHAEVMVEQAAEQENLETIYPDRCWYVIHTYSGYENKVKANLLQRVQSMGLQDKVYRIIVPTEEEVEIKDGQRRTVAKKLFPGYVLAELIPVDTSKEEHRAVWYAVRHTPGVTGFVGAGGQPTALARPEVEKILGRMRSPQPKVRVGFTKGDNVRIADGPFADFIGQVDEINVERGKIRVLVSFFGRETPVELDFLQVARL